MVGSHLSEAFFQVDVPTSTRHIYLIEGLFLIKVMQGVDSGITNSLINGMLVLFKKIKMETRMKYFAGEVESW